MNSSVEIEASQRTENYRKALRFLECLQSFTVSVQPKWDKYKLEIA